MLSVCQYDSFKQYFQLEHELLRLREWGKANPFSRLSEFVVQNSLCSFDAEKFPFYSM